MAVSSAGPYAKKSARRYRQTTTPTHYQSSLNFTGRILLLTTPLHLKYVATLPCNASLITLFF